MSRPTCDNSGKFSDIRNVRNTGAADFTIYPNPVKDIIKVDIDVDRADNGSIHIYDASGKLVFTRAISVQAGINQFNMDMNNLASGAYVIKVQLTDNTVIKKFNKM